MAKQCIGLDIGSSSVKAVQTAATPHSRPAPAGPDGTVVRTFATGRVPQLFAERSSVPAIEYVPSVRASSGVTWMAWARYLGDQLHGTLRGEGVATLRRGFNRCTTDTRFAPLCTPVPGPAQIP